ncbi:MAG: hypothetical protein K2Y32_18220 [Candidatus Obscuribacterales bacterium]|nr:hypothetical protein [Candidatus Obscuribacterales bacterium]
MTTSVLLFTVALLVTVSSAGGAFFLVHNLTLSYFAHKKRFLGRRPQGAKEKLAYALTLSGALVAALGIAFMIASYAISTWGRTLGLAVTIGISIGIVLSYLADAKRI